MNNMKQLQMAVEPYMSENNEWTPRGFGVTGWWTGTRKEAIFQYVKTPEPYICPNKQGPLPPGSHGTYQINACIGEKQAQLS